MENFHRKSPNTGINQSVMFKLRGEAEKRWKWGRLHVPEMFPSDRLIGTKKCQGLVAMLLHFLTAHKFIDLQYSLAAICLCCELDLPPVKNKGCSSLEFEYGCYIPPMRPINLAVQEQQSINHLFNTGH